MKKDVYLVTEQQSLQIANLVLPPNNELIVDNDRKTSVMVRIPKLTYADVGISSSEKALPAFIVNGKEIPYLYVSKYLNIVENDRAYSLPNKRPATFMTFEEARSYCGNKGQGWHLMTNAEWAAIALWCLRNNLQPRGNNNGNYGDVENSADKGIPDLFQDANSTSYTYTLTGSGSKSWFHNDDYSGISDLNGNVDEFVDGFRLVDSEIQIIENNNAAVESLRKWQALDPNGIMIDPGTFVTLKYDDEILKAPGLFSHVTYMLENATPDILKALALIPVGDVEGSEYKTDSFSVNKIGERYATRGGTQSSGVGAGVFCCEMQMEPEVKSYVTGFRAAYIPPEFI